MGLGRGHTLEEGTVPHKTAEIPGGTSTLQFEQVHQCLYAGTLGAPAPRGEGPHDNLNHTGVSRSRTIRRATRGCLCYSLTGLE